MPRSRPKERDQIMRRWAVIAGCGASLLAFAGCAVFRNAGEGGLPSPAQSARCQELSGLAQAAIDQQDYARARVALEQLVAEAPQLAEAQQRLGLVLSVEGRLGEAETAYRRALALDPEYVAALIGLGEIELQLGHFEPAL